MIIFLHKKNRKRFLDLLADYFEDANIEVALNDLKHQNQIHVNDLTF